MLCENGAVASAPSPDDGPVTRTRPDQVSLPEVHGTVPVPTGAGFWRKMFAFAGPGYLVAVGYMDPGNWATDIAGGARYGYALLFVVFASNLLAILLQALAARLGIASGRDLAQACRDRFSRRTTIFLWILAEIAIAATDLAEVIGSAIALQLLFGLPMAIGVCLTSADVLIVLYLQQHKFRYVEGLVVLLIAGIAAAFAVELFFSKPDLAGRRARLHPDRPAVSRPGHALRGRRHPRRDRDAAQPVPALVDRADAEIRRLEREPGRGGVVRDDRLDRGPDVGALHQRRDPGRRGGDVPRHRLPGHRRHLGRLQDADAAARDDAGVDAVRGRAAVLGPERDDHRARWPARS